MRLFFALCCFILTFTAKSSAADFNVEDPYICKNTVKNYPQLINQPQNTLEHLINAVRVHCVDSYQESVDLLAPVIANPTDLTATQMTYAYILHSINLNNVGSDESCEAAKLSMAYASDSKSPVLTIRAELNYFSFCDVYDENTPHTLKRLYELSKEALAIKNFNLQLAIHNQISYVYYLLDQNQLAAQELEIALTIGEKMQSDDYLITLYNLIDAYLDAGEIQLAKSRIDLYQRHIDEKSSTWEKWLLFYAQSYHALLSKEFERVLHIQDEIAKLGPTDSPIFTDKINIIQGLACYELKQVDCMQRIVNEHFAERDIADIRRLTLLELLVKWHGVNGDINNMLQAQEAYFALAQKTLFAQQQAAKILGVAKLNNEVIRLTSEETAKQLSHQNEINRIYTVVLSIALIMLVVFVVAYLRLKQQLVVRKQ